MGSPLTRRIRRRRRRSLRFVREVVPIVVTAALVAIGLAGTPPASADAQIIGNHRHVIFVAPYGSDQGNGSFRHPLATIQRAIDRVRRGGIVEVRGGHYAQKIAFQHDVGVTVRPYKHEPVILDGAHLPVPPGTSAMVLIYDSNQITVEGLDITGYRTTSMESVPIGIYVHGGDVGLTLRDNHVHDLGNYNRTLGNFDTNAHGIAVYGDSARHAVRDLTIEGNEVDHLTLGASESVVVNGNVNGWKIVDNLIYHNNNIGIDAIGFESTISGIYRYTDRNRARHGVIADNIIHDIRSQGNPAYYETFRGKSYWCNCANGIYVDGGTHIVIERNLVYRTDIGIEVASENTRGAADHVDVRDNFVWDSRATGISTGGYCDGHTDCGGGGVRRPGQATDTGQSFDNIFVNNTLFNNNTLHNGDPEFLVQYYAHNNLIMNNIFFAGYHNQAVLGTVPRAGADGRNTGNLIDYNIYYSINGNPGDATFGWLGKTYRGWTDYRKHTDQDRHSRFVNPDLVSLQQRNLHLRAQSPAAKAGRVLPVSVVGRWDIDHQPRVQRHTIDIGADESYSKSCWWRVSGSAGDLRGRLLASWWSCCVRGGAA